MFPITEAWNGHEIDDAVLEEYKQLDTSRGKEKNVTPSKYEGLKNTAKLGAHIGAGMATAYGIDKGRRYITNKINDKLESKKVQDPKGFKQKARNAAISVAKGGVRAAGVVGGIVANTKAQGLIGKAVSKATGESTQYPVLADQMAEFYDY